MNKNYTKIIKLQNEFSKKVITHDYLYNNNIRHVCVLLFINYINLDK